MIYPAGNPTHPPERGWVYVMESGAFPGYVKIGYTTRTPAARAAELSKALPLPLLVVASWPVSDCKAVERAAHRMLADVRMSKDREFFACSAERATDVISALADAYPTSRQAWPLPASPPRQSSGKPIHFDVWDMEQQRRSIDVQQAADILRSAEANIRQRYTGSMLWRPRNQQDYLYRRRGKIEKSLGPRGPETEAIYKAFAVAKKAALLRSSTLKRKLEHMAPVNRAMKLGRVPLIVARILRQLDVAGLLGDQVCVVGTNALFAYEAMAGLHFATELLATDDLDLAVDARKNLTLAGRLHPEGLIEVLRRVDSSFKLLNDEHYSAANATGMLVGLITPEPRQRMKIVSFRQRRLGGSPCPVPGDMSAAEIPRLEMIVDAPRVTSIALDKRGLPVAISAVDPRWWAAHKLWLAGQNDREPSKRDRNNAQAKAVASMLALHWANLDVSDAALASIPAILRDELRSAISEGEAGRIAEEW